MTACPFCAIVAGDAPATVLAVWPDAVAIEPLNPVTPGHVLVIPREHVKDFAQDPFVTAAVMHRAAQHARTVGGEMNLITSRGEAATQSVFHLHVHLVPRREGDGLALPWHSMSRPRPSSPAPWGVATGIRRMPDGTVSVDDIPWLSATSRVWDVIELDRALVPGREHDWLADHLVPRLLPGGVVRVRAGAVIARAPGSPSVTSP